jgi:pimeloyl-ACP methyl ester carboxylesterase
VSAPHPILSRFPQALYPFEPKRARVGGGGRFEVSYLDEGPKDGHLVLLVHGNPTWSLYFRGVVQGLAAAGLRAVALDHVGCGLSEKPSAERYEYTLAQRIEDLGALVAHLGVSGRPFHLVAHDWGGAIGFGYAGRHAALARRLVVLNTAAFHIPGDKRLPPSLKLGRDFALGQLLIQGLNAFSALATRWAVSRPLSADLRAAYTAPYSSWTARVATYRFVRDIPLSPRDPSYHTLSEVQAGLKGLSGRPMLIGWGLRDFVFDESFLRVWRARFPHAQVHAYTDANHYILEDKREELTPLICTFLSQELPPHPEPQDR